MKRGVRITLVIFYIFVAAVFFVFALRSHSWFGFGLKSLAAALFLFTAALVKRFN
jgi:hypothetical protein